MFLVVASYFDKKEMKIPNKLNLSFGIIRILLIPLVGIGFGNIYGMMFGFLIILIPAMIKNKPMGGDIKMMTVLGLYLGMQNTMVLLFGTIIYSLLFSIPVFLGKRKDEYVPLAPFVLASYLTIMLLTIN